MPALTIETLAFAYWELCLLLGSVRLVHIWSWKNGPPSASSADIWLFRLSTNIVLSAAIASLFSFAKLNGATSYLAAATLLLVMLYFNNFSQLKSDVRSLLSLFEEPAVARHPWLLVVLTALGLPVLWMAMRPIDEIDSLAHLYFMLDWLRNETTPYVFANNYVSFWELTYIPSLAITRSDAFFWLASLKPVLIVSLGIYCLAKTFGLSRRLALVACLNSVALFHFWGRPSGVATLKNDMLYAAGVVLIAFAITKILRFGLDRGSGLLLTLGFTFVTIKYSGPFIIVVSLLLMATLNVNRTWKARKTVLVWGLLSSIFLLATTGHYYLRNLLEHRNIFYPIKINFMNIRLPGTVDLTGTSVLESLSDARVWQAFFLPTSGISPAGYLFPLTLASILVVSTVLSARTVINLFRRRTYRSEESFLAAYILFTWLMYFRSFWSASNTPGDLFYLTNLASLRYAEGSLALSELFLIYLLSRSKSPEPLLLGLAGLSLASRLGLLYYLWMPRVGNLTLMILIVSSMSGLLLVGLSLKPSGNLRKVAGCCILSLFVFVFAPLAVESNRINWAPWWREVWLPLYDLPHAKVHVVTEPRSNEYWGSRYLLSGKRLQHDVQFGTERELLEDEGRQPDFVVKLRNPNLPNSTALADFASRLSTQGYVTIALNQFSILLQSVGVVPLTDIRNEISPRVWIMGTAEPLLPSVTVDSGHAQPAVRTLQPGGLVLFGSPRQLYLIGDRKPKAVVADEGATVLAMNAGPLDEQGKAQGLKFTYVRGSWVPSMTGIRPINPDYDFAQARATNSLGPWAISVSDGGTYEVEHLTDETGPFMRVKATSDARWLVVVGRLPNNLADLTPITVRGKIRSTSLATHSLDLFDLNATGRFDHVKRVGTLRGRWELLSLSSRVQFSSPQDYYALGLTMPKKGDYFDIRELSLFHGFFP